MKHYIGTKELMAKPMTKGEYNEYRGWETPAEENKDDKGYLVEYLDSPNKNHEKHDNYISWSPKDVFERTYKVVRPTKGTIPLRPVYPTSQVSVIAHEDDMEYGGAHRYSMLNCIGFVDGQTKYDGGEQTIQFVQKLEDESIVPGIQNEQLLTILIDRMQKLNKKFPCRENAIQITKLQEALMWQEARTRERIDRGVMGNLEK